MCLQHSPLGPAPKAGAHLARVQKLGICSTAEWFSALSSPTPGQTQNAPLVPRGISAPILHPETPERSVVVAVEGDQD